MSRKAAIMLRARHPSSSSRLRGSHWKILTGAAALASATVGFTSFAGATTPRVPATPAADPDGVSTSTRLAGYQATPPGAVSSASATFTVPKITCTKKEEAHHDQIELGVYASD